MALLANRGDAPGAPANQRPALFRKPALDGQQSFCSPTKLIFLQSFSCNGTKNSDFEISFRKNIGTLKKLSQWVVQKTLWNIWFKIKHFSIIFVHLYNLLQSFQVLFDTVQCIIFMMFKNFTKLMNFQNEIGIQKTPKIQRPSKNDPN